MIKLALHVGIVILVMALNVFPQQWTKLTPTFSTRDTMLDMSQGIMITKNIGWFTATTPVNQYDKVFRIYKTSDGGYMWTVQYEEYFKGKNQLVSFSEASFISSKSIMAVDSLHCWIQFLQSLLKTTDGGETWKYHLIDSAIPQGYSRKLFFFNQNEGYLYWKYPRVTTDGGDTWKILDTLKKLNLFTDIIFPSRNIGWITGAANPRCFECGYLAQTVDSGRSWSYVGDTTYPPQILIAIDFVDSMHGYIVGANGFGAGFAYFSTDGGEHWGGALARIASPTNIAFLDSSYGWISGAYGVINATTDGGHSWNLSYDLGEPIWIGNLCPIRSNHVVYAFGEKNTLLRFDVPDDIRTNKSNPLTFNLSQNYPNPFNNETIINFQLPSSGDVTLKVYNVLGEEIASLIEGYRYAGETKIRWNGKAYNGNDVPSGVYFYKLFFQGNMDCKTLIVVK